MITDTQVMGAKSDQQQFLKLYNYFFSGTMLEAFLINFGISDKDDRCEIEQELYKVFLNRINKFRPGGHIPFEKQMWHMFKYHILNHHRKQRQHREKGIENYGHEMEIPASDIQSPYIEIDLDVDLEIVAKELDERTRMIFDLMVNGYERKDLPSLNIPVKWWDKARPIIQSLVLQAGIL